MLLVEMDPGWSVNPDGVTHVQPLPDNPQNLTSLMRSFTLHSPYPISREISSNSQPVIMTSAGFENFRRDSIELNREEVKRSALIQTPVITNVCTMPASQSPLPVPILSPICDPNSSSGQLLGYSNATSYSVPYDGDMLQWALQNSLKQNNPYSPVAHVLVPHPVNHPSAMQLNKSQSLGCYFHPHAILPTFNSTQSGDLRSVGTLPIRGQPPLSSFCIPQTPNVTDSYRAAYPIPETNDASQPFNQAVAVALASMSANSRNHVNVHQRALHSHFSNQLITNSSNIGSIGTNQQQPMSHLHALATMSAAAHHQNVSPSCILNSITRTPFRMSTPLPLPVYYAASQIPFQTVIPQNAFNQLHSTVHPMHNYIYRAVDKIGSCESSDILKLDSNCSLSVPNLTQRTNKSMCPLFLLPALQIQKNKSHAPNLNTSELQIPSARRAASSAGLTSIHTSSKAVNARGNMSGAGTPAFTSPLPKTNFPATKLTVGDTTENVFDVTRNTISDRRPVLPVTTSSNESPYGIVISKDDSGRTCKQVDNVTSPGSVHDSEDSVSSGIGDMTAATANQNDSQNNSRTATRIVAKCKYTRDKSSSQIKGKMTRM
ncbi:unnamed protein product [Trichobilharzia regenti]|nr:unnamed protein product [Trichobilharzia regenti]